MSTEMSSPTINKRSSSHRMAGPNILRVIHSEWIKLWSLRSTYWTLIISFILTTGLSLTAIWASTMLAAHAAKKAASPIEKTDISTLLGSGYLLGIIPLLVLGTLIATGEYASRQALSTFHAVPRRSLVFVAKMIVIGIVATILGVFTSLTTWGLGRVIFTHTTGSLFSKTALATIMGTALIMIFASWVALGIGFIVRSTAGAVTASMSIFLLIPVLITTLNIWFKWVDKVAPYVPMAFMPSLANPTVTLPSPTLSFGMALLTALAWVGIPLTGGLILLNRKDV